MIKLWFLYLLASLALAGVVLSMISREKPKLEKRLAHFDGQRFHNNYIQEDHTVFDVLRWKWQTRNHEVKRMVFPHAADKTLVQRSSKPRITWISHATVLVQAHGLNLLLDPNFSQRASPVSFIGPSRVTPLPFDLDQLPPIDLVAISHNHYDHFDLPSIEKLIQRQTKQPKFLVPLKLGDEIRNLGAKDVVELDWWQEATFGQWRMIAVPAQHFSRRGPFDFNKTLWAGWVFLHPDFRLYFMGDSGYSPDFKKIGQRFGPFDLALIPIGSYQPRWFMKSHHVDPIEAVQAHLDVQAKRSMAIHFGSFILTDEPMDEPMALLRQALSQQGIAHEDFLIPLHGQSLTLNQTLALSQSIRPKNQAFHSDAEPSENKNSR